MPAFNFKGQFVERIQDGSKGGTIRKHGKRRPVREGQTLFLYYGQRTKWCKKIMEAPCVEVWAIAISEYGIGMIRNHKRVKLDTITELNRFAVSDGFPDWATMKRYWLMHDGLPFEGFHVRWIPLKEQVLVTY